MFDKDSAAGDAVSPAPAQLEQRAENARRLLAEVQKGGQLKTDSTPPTSVVAWITSPCYRWKDDYSLTVRPGASGAEYAATVSSSAV